MTGSGGVAVEVIVLVGPSTVTGPAVVIKPVPVGPSALVLAWVRARVVSLEWKVV